MEILFESNYKYNPVQFIKKDFKKRSEVKVASVCNGRPIVTHMIYRFNNIPLYEHKYLSWENLNCVNGWVYDETYLYTAVQKDKKLVAAMDIQKLGKSEKELVTEKANEWGLDTSIANIYMEKQQHPHPDWLSLIIIRKGCLKDFYDFNEIIEAYRKQDIILTPQGQDSLKEYFKTELSDLFYEGKYNFDYANCKSAVEFIVCGLGLGYPIESTASILNQ